MKISCFYKGQLTVLNIRNLIDAVEDHSDQYIREDTVSSLIDVKRFVQPLLHSKVPASQFVDILAKHLLTNGNGT